MNRVDCNGTEGNIKQCQNFKWGPSSCKLMEAASVTCIYQDNDAPKGKEIQLFLFLAYCAVYVGGYFFNSISTSYGLFNAEI